MNITAIKKLARVVAPVGSNRRTVSLAALQAVGINVGSNNEYKQWIKNREPLDIGDEQPIDNSIKVSIVVPGYNTPQRYLDDLITSVIAQSYTNWELVFGDGSDDEDRAAAIKQSASRDERIRIVRLEKNDGISENTNRAIEEATGELIAFMDHDDTLAINALEESVRALRKSDADLVYSDEDLLSENGRKRVSPHFKPDWSLDLLRHVNYITHFVVVKTEIVRKLGGLRKDFDGAQDYDFLLRAADLDIKIAHVPKILYHWRIAKGSTASDPDSKPYAWDAGKRAIEEHYSRQGIGASVKMDSKNHGNYHTSFNGQKNKQLTVVFGEAVGKRSSQRLYEMIQKQLMDVFAEIKQITTKQLLSSNDTADLDDEGLVLFINAELRLEEDADWVERLVSVFADPKIGVAQPLIVSRDDKIVDYLVSYSETGEEVNVFKGIELGSGTYTGSTSWPRNCSYVSSKVFCVRTSVFPAINEKTLPNTVRQISIDACRSAGAKGLRSLVYPASMVSLEAYEQSSTDPYLNPNIDISLEHARLYEDRGRSEGSNEK